MKHTSIRVNKNKFRKIQYPADGNLPTSQFKYFRWLNRVVNKRVLSYHTFGWLFDQYETAPTMCCVQCVNGITSISLRKFALDSKIKSIIFHHTRTLNVKHTEISCGIEELLNPWTMKLLSNYVFSNQELMFSWPLLTQVHSTLFFMLDVKIV